PTKSTNYTLSLHYALPICIFSEKVIHISEQTLSRDEAIDQLIENLNEQGYITDQSQLKSDVLKREMESTTAIGMNVDIPHAKSEDRKSTRLNSSHVSISYA